MRLRSVPLLLLLLASLATSLSADTYPRQPLDVEHYRFAITLADTTDRIAGEATVRLRVLAGVSAIALDLANVSPTRDSKGMTVQGVRSGEQALVFAHASDRLQITLAAPEDRRY